MKRYNLLNLCVIIITITALSSCKQYFDPPLVFEPDPGQSLTKDRKVLLISVDGLAGLELKKYTPININKMLEHAKYTFEGITDANTRDASSWTTMLSGKKSTKHGVLGNSFLSEEEEDDDDIHDHEGTGSSTGYISVYQRLLETGRVMKTLSVTPWNELDQYLFNLSDENGAVESDEAVKTKAVNRIKNGEDNLTFAVINFRGLNEAGKAGGFSVENAGYKSKLDQIDGYIGELLGAVAERKGNEKEDWLIILTSNHGGIGNSYGGASLEERKVPMIFYNENFVKSEFTTPALMNSIRMNSKGKQDGEYRLPFMSAANSAPYDLKADKEYTILFKVYNYGLPTGDSHEVILGRTTHAYSSIRGWHFMITGGNNGNKYRTMLGYGSGTSVQAVAHSATAAKEVWETVAVKLYFEGSKRFAVTYVNGTPSSIVDMTGRDLTTSAANFWLGSGDVASIGTFNGKINNVTFVEKALTEQEIKEFACLQTIDEAVPYWSYVKGYWPLNEGSGTVLSNKVPNAPNNTMFTFTPSYAPWDLNESWRCDVLTDEEKKTNKLIYSVDILPQVFYWLNVATADSWGLEGKVFLDAFEREFVRK